MKTTDTAPILTAAAALLATPSAAFQCGRSSRFAPQHASHPRASMPLPPSPLASPSASPSAIHYRSTPDELPVTLSVTDDAVWAHHVSNNDDRADLDEYLAYLARRCKNLGLAVSSVPQHDRRERRARLRHSALLVPSTIGLLPQTAAGRAPAAVRALRRIAVPVASTVRLAARVAAILPASLATLAMMMVLYPLFRGVRSG